MDTKWYVVNNITGHAASRAFDTEDTANRTCYGLNLQAGPGGLYGVEFSRDGGATLERVPFGWDTEMSK